MLARPVMLALFLFGTTTLSAQKVTLPLKEGFDAAIYPNNLQVYFIPAEKNQIVISGMLPNLDRIRVIDRVLYIEVQKSSQYGHIVLFYDQAQIRTEYAKQ